MKIDKLLLLNKSGIFKFYEMKNLCIESFNRALLETGRFLVCLV